MSNLLNFLFWNFKQNFSLHNFRFYNFFYFSFYFHSRWYQLYIVILLCEITGVLSLLAFYFSGSSNYKLKIHSSLHLLFHSQHELAFNFFARCIIFCFCNIYRIRCLTSFSFYLTIDTSWTWWPCNAALTLNCIVLRCI